MTQSELSKKTGIRAATINEMYHELIERVNLDYLSRICTVLDCEVHEILQFIPDDEYREYRRKNRIHKLDDAEQNAI